MLAVLLSLSLTGCAVEPAEQRTARVTMADRYGLTPRDLSISTRGAFVLSVRETRPKLRSPDETARLARELAREVAGCTTVRCIRIQ
jgi:hypothetical protein